MENSNFHVLHFLPDLSPVLYKVALYATFGNMNSAIWAVGKVIYTKYSKHSNETNTFMGLGRAGRFGQS